MIVHPLPSWIDRLTVTLTGALLLAGSLLVAAPCLATSASEYRQRGLDYRNQEQYAAAIAAIKKSIKLEPENLSGRVLLGWTLHQAGQDTEAATVLRQALAINPFDVPTLNALGIVYLVGGELSAAVATHLWAAVLQSNDEIAYYNLSLAFQRLQQSKWAIAMAIESANLEPSNPHPFVALAIAHWSAGDRASALQAYRQALNLDARYRSSDFLNYLSEAGFSPEQIQHSKQVLQAVS